MTISTDEKYLLNNKMGSIARKVQLGTLIENAESVAAGEIAVAQDKILIGSASGVGAAQTMSGDATLVASGALTIANLAVTNAKVATAAAIAFSKMEAVASARLLVGSGANVPTAVDVTGDVTISNTGVTAIGAAKITEAMLKAPSVVGLQTKRLAYALFDPSAVAGDRTIGAHALAAIIPDNAFVTGIWYWVETTLTSATDAGTVALSIVGADDVVVAVAISDGGNPWDTTAKPVEGVTKLETTSTWLYTVAASAITATVAVEALTAGKVHIWAEYLVHG